MAIQDSKVIQQYIISRVTSQTTLEIAEVEFDLDPRIALRPVGSLDTEFETYEVRDYMNVSLDSNDDSLLVQGEPKSEEEVYPAIGKLELQVALFEDGKAVSYGANDSHEMPRIISHKMYVSVHPRELTVVYDLEARNSNVVEATDTKVLPYIDVCQFLKNDRHGLWKIKDLPSDFDFVFRRNLEHILSVCTIPVPRGPDQRRGISFISSDLDAPCSSEGGSL
jgi:hypothetical protein